MLSATTGVGTILVGHFVLMLVVPFLFLYRERRRPGIAQLGVVAVLMSWVFQSAWTFALILPAFLFDIPGVPGAWLLWLSLGWVVLGALVCYPLLAWVVYRMARAVRQA